jgi:heptosyltransferase-3
LRSLKRRDPHCTVIFLTNPRTADLARCCPDIDEVYGEPETPEELRALLASLDIDIFIQVNNSRVNAIAAYEAVIPVRIGSLFRFYNLRLCTHLWRSRARFPGSTSGCSTCNFCCRWG